MNERIKKLVEAWDNGIRTTAENLVTEMRTAIEEAEKQELVAFDVYVKHDRIYFSIGNQSFPIDYTPEDEPECSAGQAADWYMGQLRHALQRLSNTTPPAAQRPVIKERKWVGLDDHDLDVLFLNADGVRFARYIEAKLKEKNT